MNNFKCPHCDKYHKNGHPKANANWNKFREQRDVLRRENNSLKRQLDSAGVLSDIHASIFSPIKKEPDLPIESSELIVGYRVWRYINGYLTSAFKTNVTWPHRKALTRDIYDDMGIHACRDYKKVLPLLSEYCSVEKIHDEIIDDKTIRGIAGSIYMWGEVKEHADGYLAEFAYPKEFFVGDDWDPLLAMQLEEDYGVSVNFRAELSRDKWPAHDSFNPMIGSWRSYNWTWMFQPPVFKSNISRKFFTYAVDDVINESNDKKQDALAKDDPKLRQLNAQSQNGTNV